MSRSSSRFFYLPLFTSHVSLFTASENAACLCVARRQAGGPFERLRACVFSILLEDHVVVCGVCHTGLAAIRELLAKGTSREQILAIDHRDDAVRAAVALGVVAIRGDVSHESTLRDAALDKARAVILTTTGRDETNILVLLSVRHV